jgi:DNA-binding CsgD family transcriptional regulator
MPRRDSFDVGGGVVLSPRESEVLACLVCGRSVKGAAALLGVTPKTVESHLRSLSMKTGCYAREALTAFARSRGIVPVLRDRYDHLENPGSEEKDMASSTRVVRGSGSGRFLAGMRSRMAGRWGLVAGGVLALGVGLLVWAGTRAQTSKDGMPVRMELPLPKGEALLDRTELLQKADSLLNPNKGITVLALVGPGGSGKTTLARRAVKSKMCCKISQAG